MIITEPGLSQRRPVSKRVNSSKADADDPTVIEIRSEQPDAISGKQSGKRQGENTEADRRGIGAQWAIGSGVGVTMHDRISNRAVG
jgi:hypothetical protein